MRMKKRRRDDLIFSKNRFILDSTFIYTNKMTASNDNNEYIATIKLLGDIISQQQKFIQEILNNQMTTSMNIIPMISQLVKQKQ